MTASTNCVLTDLKIDGVATPVMMKADRNGFFYVLNRETGKLISAEKFVPTNWASKIDPATTRPVEDPDKRPGPDHPAKNICPNLIGGKNWQPMSFSPKTGFVYIPSNNICQDMSEAERGRVPQGRVLPRQGIHRAAWPGRLPR